TADDQLAHAACDRSRLALAPARTRVAVALLVAHEQLDRMPEDRVGELAGRCERLVALAELFAEEVVDRRQHFGPRPVVPRQRQSLRGRLAPLAEDGDVGVTES